MFRFRAALCAAGALLLARASADDQACDGHAADDLTSLLQVDHLTAIRQHNHEQAAAEQTAEQGAEQFPWAPKVWPANSSFVSHNGTLCFEGDQRAAESALALRKAGIRGALFDNVLAGALGCKMRGYHADVGVDPCNPGVTIYIKSLSDVYTGWAAMQNATQAWATKYGLDINTTNEMADCTCHINSVARQARVKAGTCAKLDAMTGAWLNRDPTGGPSLNCYEGPFTTAVWSLAAMKAGPLLPLHLHDSVEATTCAKLGFPYNNSKASTDDCFTPLTMYTATKDLATDPGSQKAAVAAAMLIKPNGTAKLLKTMFGNAQVLATQQVMGCQCLDNSRMFAAMKASGNCTAAGAMTPIRDWWKVPVEQR